MRRKAAPPAVLREALDLSSCSSEESAPKKKRKRKRKGKEEEKGKGKKKKKKKGTAGEAEAQFEELLQDLDNAHKVAEAEAAKKAEAAAPNPEVRRVGARSIARLNLNVGRVNNHTTTTQRNTIQDAQVTSFFEPGGRTTNKAGKTMAVMCCLVCNGTMKGYQKLDRTTSGKLTIHSKDTMKAHLARHGINFGCGPQEEQQQQRQQVVKQEKGQTKLEQFARFTPQQQEELTQAIVLMCALDNRPFAVVEGRGFRMVLEKATGKRYTVPSRWTIKRKCVSMAEQARKVTRTTIKADVEGGATFTMSFDAWKDRYARALGPLIWMDWLLYWDWPMTHTSTPPHPA